MLATQTALKPLRIGDIIIESPLALAPMAGHTNYALRRLCREFGGCGLVCTELISSNIVKNSRARARQRFDWRAKLTLETTHLPEHVAVREMRGQISKYQLDAPGSRRIRNRLVRIDSFAELESILLGVALSE